MSSRRLADGGGVPSPAMRNSARTGSGRRVNFDYPGPSASSRRGSTEQSLQQYPGSSSRKLPVSTGSPLAGGGGGGGGANTLSALSPDQQSATHSAVSMNSIFAEARREIRRGLARDSAIRSAAERGDDGQVAGTPAHQRQPSTPGKDLEAGGESAEHESGELNWHTDLAAMRDMLQGNMVLSSMLLCIPLGVIAHLTNLGGVSARFIFNFVAIIPLAWLLGNATEELALRSNQTIGGLLNATFGNAVELIVSIVALRKGMIKLVQTSLLGSILSNCLLVLGMAFTLGGMKNKVQPYNSRGAHMLSSLLLLASIALVLPAAYVNSFQPHPSMAHLLRISRITALILFVTYSLYLFFQLVTHSELFEDEQQEERRPRSRSEEHEDEESQEHSPLVGTYAAAAKKGNGKQQQRARNQNAHPHIAIGPNGVDVPTGGAHSHGYQASAVAEDGATDESDSEPVQQVSDNMNELSDLLEGPASTRGPRASLPASIAEGEETGSGRNSGGGSARLSGSPDSTIHGLDGGSVAGDDDEDDEDLPQMTLYSSIALLLVVTIAVSACSEFLVDSIEEVTRAWGISESFVGMILLPIVGNAAEHATAVTVAMKNKMDLSIGVAIGSSTQISLFLIPAITLLGWAIDQPMSLNFSSFETICLFASVLMVSTLLKNGESNWLQGVMLIGVYLIIGTAFWFVPEHTDPKFQNHNANWMADTEAMQDVPTIHRG